MKKSLSILLPSYNNRCYTLVAALKAQADSIGGLSYEIIVADDGSRDQVAVISNLRINELQHCRYIRRRENVGRAAIRNFLASEAEGERLLFLDSDVHILSDTFLAAYLATTADVVNGGVRVTGTAKPSSLRYLYESHAEPCHTAQRRTENGYKNFRSTNFMISRAAFSRCRFDEGIKEYGYEDTLFGLDLEASGISLTHIDNPVGIGTDESNQTFLLKTEASLRTLKTLESRIGYSSPVVRCARRLRSLRLQWAMRLCHRLFSPIERRNLLGRRPSLTVFKMYKLGYYTSL